MENKKFTKADLKAGYIVKMRYGSLNMVTINDSNKLIVVNKNGSWMNIDSYDDCLCNRGSYHNTLCIPDHRYDIIEVYGGCRLECMALEIDIDYRKLLWKREPEKTCDDCAHKVVCPHVGMCEHFLAKN